MFLFDFLDVNTVCIVCQYLRKLDMVSIHLASAKTRQILATNPHVWQGKHQDFKDQILSLSPSQLQAWVVCLAKYQKFDVIKDPLEK